MNQLSQLRTDLIAQGSPTKAVHSARFFKTGPGQYGEGDCFIGVTVPEQRKLARRYRNLPLADIKELLHSPIHEERLTALLILVDRFQRGDQATQRRVYDLYLNNTRYINNWDLVDSSASYIVGAWLADKNRSVLVKLARSDLLWERRIAMLATFYFIQHGESDDALNIAELLLYDQHDLIQKAVGWMLREVGKRCSVASEEAFLIKHQTTMPRTTLRYAIERFTPERREQYLAGTAA